MIKSITLKCFRKHEDTHIDFTEGLNIIRGSNEAGKSTIYEAILYAIYGSTALRESLSNVATLGHKESEVCVILTMQMDHTYTIKRSTSGAEIHQDSELLVTGQTATKSFMETKLGCKLAIAQQIMFASQSAIKGVISENSTANALVETLANVGQIEALITSINAQLPTGATTAVDQHIKTLEETLAEPVAQAPSDSQVKEKEALKSEAEKRYEALLVQMPTSSEIGAAESKVQEAAKLEAEHAKYLKDVAELQAVIADVPTLDFTEADFQLAEQVVMDETLEARRFKSYSKTFPEYVGTKWAGDSETLDVEIQRKQTQLETLNDLISSRNQELTRKQAQLITETTCSLCKKDLTDVPEVVQTNTKLGVDISRLQVEVKTLVDDRLQRSQDLAQLKLVAKATSDIYRLVDEFWHVVEDGTLPPTVEWLGAPPQSGGNMVEQYAKMKHQKNQYDRAMLRIDNAKEALSKSLEPVLIDVRHEAAILSRYKLLKNQADLCETKVRDASRALSVAQAQYEGSVAAYEAAFQARSKLETSLTEAKQLRSKMLTNNALIKKLRDVRPQLTAKMWNTLQGAISHYFSAMRQVECVVERSASGFTVDGRSVEGLSGSTTDILGLAIRISLGKIFLPWVPFLLLDEGFSACDGEREMASVGVLASSGFQQVVLITHSDAPESMADNLVYL